MAISYSAALDAPLLEAEQERDLIQQWQIKKDRASLQVLITSHARQIHSCARRLNSNPDHHDDLVAEGMIGLIHAADRFEPAKQVRFSTYAHWWVLNYVRKANTRLKHIVDVPKGREIEASLSSEALAFMPGVVEALDGELDESLRSDAPTPEEHAIAESGNAEMRRVMLEALKELGDVEQDIVISRNLRRVPESVDDIAKRLGVGRARLRQIERRAMSRMKFALLSRGVTTAMAG
ncbi:RNA polymerase factor sigma-32 [Cognatishimia sp. WU-CL00825]|uniref:sigma-70 family RNA polymerase sigma factor n=1 Tax=Cognatishimia sp. WU-CL00825 TaxID=3127658 RepID=UPI0031067452